MVLQSFCIFEPAFLYLTEGQMKRTPFDQLVQMALEHQRPGLVPNDFY